MTDIPRLVLFDGTDFDKFVDAVEYYCKRNGWSSYIKNRIDTEYIERKFRESAEAFAKRQRENEHHERVMATITQFIHHNCDEERQKQIGNLKNPWDIMGRFRAIYVPSSETFFLRLVFLISSRKVDDDSFVETLDKLQESRRLLAERREFAVKESLLVEMILKYLPKKWELYGVLWRDEKELTFDELCSRFRKLDNLEKQKLKQNTDENIGTLVQRTNKKFKPTCTRCGKRGHLGSQCYTKICGFCFKKGHLRDECWEIRGKPGEE